MRRITDQEKQRRGTLQPSRSNGAAPVLPPELPPPPDGLDERVLAAYMAHGARLMDMKVLTRADSFALVALASAWVDWQRAIETLEEFKTDNGSEYYWKGDLIKTHPAVGVRNEAQRRYRGWCQSFGLTPGDRAKVAVVDAPSAKSSMAKILEMVPGREQTKEN
jgi:P27 family predicted phage terminase small subunit